jgi:hypothetical protein
MNIDSVLTITGVTASTNASGNPVTCNPPVPGLINTNLVICSMASLGGPFRVPAFSLQNANQGFFFGVPFAGVLAGWAGVGAAFGGAPVLQ